MTTTATNGRPQRKQLSDQLDRLDGIIDCLADALPEAVRDAVRDGTRDALQQLLAETLASPETVALIRRAVAPDSTPPAAQDKNHTGRAAAFLARCRSRLAGAARAAEWVLTVVKGRVTAAAAGAKARTAGVVRRARAVAAVARVGWEVKKAAAVAAGVGVAVAGVAVFSHPVATVLSGVGAAGMAFAVQLGLWARGVARRLTG